MNQQKKIREVSPRHAHLVLDVVDDRWDRQMSRDLHMAGKEINHISVINYYLLY